MPASDNRPVMLSDTSIVSLQREMERDDGDGGGEKESKRDGGAPRDEMES